MIQVFSKQWFNEHRKILCQTANSPIGEKVFNFGKMGHYPYGKIVDIDPNSITELVGIKNGRATLKRHYFGRNEYALRLQRDFYPLWSAIHTWDMFIANKFKPAWNLGFDTLTVYPDADPESTSVDGGVAVYQINQTWATLLARSGDQANDDRFEFSGSVSHCCIGFQGGTTAWDMIIRSIALFDTSALTASATISAAVLSLYGNAKTDSDSNSPNINIYTSNPATDTALVGNDFSTLGSTAQCDTTITYAGWSTTGYNDFTLNATGRGNVSKTGISKFGMRNVNYDVAATSPSYSQYGEGKLGAIAADNGSNKPKLVVTYSVVADTGNFFQLF